MSQKLIDLEALEAGGFEYDDLEHVGGIPEGWSMGGCAEKTAVAGQIILVGGLLLFIIIGLLKINNVI
jgi:hypothetical protein